MIRGFSDYIIVFMNLAAYKKGKLILKSVRIIQAYHVEYFIRYS